MANTKVEIKVAANAETVYIVGSTKSLGEWDAKKAVELEKCEACGKFVVCKMLPAGETIEFKVLTGKTWDAVEKDTNGYDVENHSFVANKGLSVEVEVANFAK